MSEHFLQTSLFFFNDTATTEIYTLSLHDALPISGVGEAPDEEVARPHVELRRLGGRHRGVERRAVGQCIDHHASRADRKSTRLNSSHANISYAVFCLKKKKPARESRPYLD